MTCSMGLTDAQIEGPRHGDLVCVIYGPECRYYYRIDDATGTDVGCYHPSRGLTFYAPSRPVPWAPMMRAQRGTVDIVASNVPNSRGAILSATHAHALNAR